MNEEILKELKQEDLTNLTVEVENASQEYAKVYSKEKMIKENKKEFTEHLINAFTEQFKEKFDERKEKLIKSLFNKIVISQTEGDSETEEKTFKAGYLRKRVEDMVMLIYAYRYLKYNNINKMFEEYGIKLEFEPIENILLNLSGTNFKETLKQFIDNSIDLRVEKDNIEYNVRENIYTKIPDTLKYDKEHNKTGITKNTFKKFSLLKLLKKINPFKAQKKCQDMTQDANTKARADVIAVSIADTIVSEEEKK